MKKEKNQMEENIDPDDRISLFDPVITELGTLHHKNEIYRKHLKDFRTFLWVALITLSVLIYWHGERDRYRHTKDFFILDSKTGQMYLYGEKVD